MAKNHATPGIYRPWESVLIAAVGAAFTSAFPLALLLAGLRVGRDNQVIFWLPVAIVAGAALLWAATRVSLRVNEEGLLVTNTWRRHTVRWHEVSEIAVSGWWPSVTTLWLSGSCVRIRTAGGRRVFIEASVNTGADRKIVAALRGEGERRSWIRLAFG